MKFRYALMASVMLTAAGAHAQKSELKTLRKIHDKQQLTAKDIDSYKSAITAAEPQISAAADSDQVYFQYYKSIVPMLALGLPENQANPMNVVKSWNKDVVINMATAAAAVLEHEKVTGKKELTDDINNMIAQYKPLMQNLAVTLGNDSKNKEAATVLNAIYRLDTTDVDNLYYAASYAVNAKDYDNALSYYDELKKLNYSGETVVYYATSMASDKEESFPTKAERDKLISLKTHKSPRQETEPSKRGEIYKNTALILVQQNKVDEAKAAIAAARRENPEDISLLMTEADLFLQLKDFDGYKKVVGDVLAKNPNDVDLVFNLGVISMQAKQNEDAEKHFKRAIEIDPNYINAHINLAGLILQGDKKLVDEMNALGTSTADNKRYDALKKQRVEMFRKALPYLEKAHQIDSESELVIDNLISTYGVLEMTDKFKALKAKR